MISNVPLSFDSTTTIKILCVRDWRLEYQKLLPINERVRNQLVKNMK